MSDEVPASDHATIPGGITRRDFVKYSVCTTACLYLGTLNTGCAGSMSATAVSGPPPAPIAAPASETAWSFAVMADTQWIDADDGKNPESVSVGIINQLNAEFIKHQVKFVVQVGDLTNSGTQLGLNIRATYAQALYNAGIGFFPLRGNHESSAENASDFVHAFPQTRTGMHNATPADSFAATDDDDETGPMARFGSPFPLGSNFSSPNSRLQGLTYSFDYGNARFVLLDQYTPFDGGSNSIASQQSWLSGALSSRPAGSHAFVLSHQGVVCPYQPDSLFGTYPSASFESMFVAQDAFIGSLYDNGVRYHIFGHDHFHERNISTTSDGSGKKVTEIFSAPSANELFLPKAAQEWYDPAQFPGFQRSISSQEINRIGYYIYTVDGPHVTVDYYGAEVPTVEVPGGYTDILLMDETPTLTFTRRETFGYGQAGKEFLIPQGGTYSTVEDSFRGTTAKILGGVNAARNLDYNGVPMTRAVNTGWQDGPMGSLSPVLNLWGMELLGSGGNTDTYTLALQYNPGLAGNGVVENGWLALATPVNGVWSNAADRNSGGTKKFIRGPWIPAYGLGSYGFDPATNTAWAVIDYNAAFAVVPFGENP
jgi:hypothetical protein